METFFEDDILDVSDTFSDFLFYEMIRSKTYISECIEEVAHLSSLKHIYCGFTLRGF